jgi:glycosyltransferase involved in cell wall biosynthesis
MVGDFNMTAPVSVCMIVRDEEHQLGTCLGSLRPFVKEIVVVDTGSKDRTLDVANRHADVVKIFTDCNDSAGRMLRFDLARNYSFSLATQPWVMWADADDVIVGAEQLESLIRTFDAERRGQPSMVMMPYEYSHDGSGRCDLLLERERLVTPRQHFEWHKWVHEVLSPKGGDVRQRTDAIKVVHRRAASKKKSEPGRNLRILEAQHAAEGDGDARDLYYLGQELGYAGRIDEAISFLSKHIDRSGWDDERYMSARLIANHFKNRGEYEKAVEWAMKAVLIREDWGEAYFTIAECAYYIAQRTNSLRWWQRSAHFALTGLSKPPTQTSLFVNPLERDFEIHKFLNMALSKIGDTKGALASVSQGLSVRPDDAHLLFNKRVYEEYEAVEGFKQSLDRLVTVGKITREVRDHLQIMAEKNADPLAGEQTNGVAHASTKKKGLRPLDPQHLNIVFYVGYSVEAWNPETFRRSGLGGSETAVVEMSERLVKLGHHVRVFGDCKAIEGVFQDVEYIHYEKFQDVTCDVLISSRRPEAIDRVPALGCRLAVLWVHDVHCGDQLTPERADKFNLIWTLSEWHRGYFMSKYPFLDLEKVGVTRNGIDLERFDRTALSPPKPAWVVRDPRRAVYSSSPDRGLQVALETWPEIRARVPGAELHVFYGFNNWEPYAGEAEKKLIAELKKLLAETEGVQFHGRQHQDRLAEEFLKSGVWAYPTWFHETSCITGMEAQAAGLRIVTSPIAALNETVGSRGTMISGNWLSAPYKEKFVNAVVEAMLKEGHEDRQALAQYAREHFGWDELAKEWESMFIELLGTAEAEADEEEVIPAYQEFRS